MKTPYKAILPTVATTVSEKPTQGVEQIARGLDAKVLARLLSAGDTHDRDLVRKTLVQMKKENLDEISIELNHFGQPVILDRAYLTVLYEALTKQALCHRFGAIRSVAELKKMDPVYAEIMSDAKVSSEFAKKLDAIRDQRDKLAIGYDRWADIVSVRNLIAQLEDEELGLQLRAQKGLLNASQSLRLDEIQLQIVSLRHQLSGSDDHGNRVGLEVESREVATVVRTEQLMEWFRQIKENNFAEFASRKEIMDEIRSAMLSGKSTLITGATGTGKTVLAVQVAKQIQRKMVELSGDNIIDAKLLSDELKKNPDYVAVLSGNANMTVGEIIAKIGIKAIDDGKGGKIMETSTQLGKILKAYTEGRIPIFDEIDLVPNDILMRTKHLATLRPGEIYTPQENGGSEVWIRNNIQLATANLKGSHHPDREDLDPAIVRLYQGITAGYLTKDEAYDRAVLSGMSPNGSMIGISPAEWKKDGFVTRIVEFMKQIEDNYMGLTPLGAGIDSSDQYLSKAVMDIGIFSGLFAGYQSNRRAGTKIRNFREYVTDNLIKFITNQGYPLSDRMMLIQMANAKGLIDIAHKETILKKCPDLSAATFTGLLTNTHSDLSAYDTHTVAILTPYELAQLDPYEVRKIDQLEWSQYAQISELSRVLSTLEGHFLTDADHPIAQQVNALLAYIATNKGIDETVFDALILALEEAKEDDKELQKLFEKLSTTTLGQTSVGRVQATIDRRMKKRAEEAEAERVRREKEKKYHTQDTDIQEKIEPTTPSGLFESITSGPEYDRIMQYRQDFLTQIKNTEKTPSELAQIGEQMIQSGEFTLGSQAGLTVGWFMIGGYDAGFTNSDQIFTDQTADPDDMLEKYEYNNTVLSKGKKHLPKLKALKSNVISERKEPIRASIQALEPQGVVFDSSGDLKKLIQIIMDQKGLNESDALAVYMYLTTMYGGYRTGQYENNNRGYVGLIEDFRRFSSFGVGYNDASLLCSVNRSSGPRSGVRSTTPLSAEVVANQKRWKENVSGIDDTLLDPTTNEQKTYPSGKEELTSRLDERMSKYVTQISNPKGNLGTATQIAHPQFNSGKPRHFYESTAANRQAITGQTDTDNFCMQYDDYVGQKQKLSIKLRSIRGDMDHPDTLPDEIYEDEINKSGKKEKNYTKTYLQELKKRAPGMQTQLEGQLIALMQIIGDECHLPPEPNSDQPLRKAALMYVLCAAGLYRTGQYKNDNRGYVSLNVDYRGFRSNDRDVNFASLLCSRDG